MINDQSVLDDFKPRTSWQGFLVVIVGLALFGSQWLMPNSELFAHVKMKIYADSGALAQHIGQPVSDVKWLDVEGREFSLEEYKGKRVVLNVFATWCLPCKVEISAFNQFAQTADKNTVVIGLTVEEPETVKAFLKEVDFNYVVGIAIKLPAPFDQITSVPTTVIISPDGVIEKVHSGALKPDDLQLLFQQACELNLKRPVKKAAVVDSQG
jgi:thiol-disulfide isomerase/thioredoxin